MKGGVDINEPCHEKTCLRGLRPVKTQTSLHTSHKLWNEICQIRQIQMGDLIKFCEIFTKITLKLPPSSQKPVFECMKLVINTTKCDVCLFLHKVCFKVV